MMSDHFRAVGALSAMALLSACGGGSGVDSATSVPGPTSSQPVSVVSTTIVGRTPLQQTVATKAGTYDSLAALYVQIFDKGRPGAITVTSLDSPLLKVKVDPAAKAFTLTAQFPDGDVSRSYVGSSAAALHSSVATNEFYGDFGYNIQYQYTFSDGTKSDVRNQDITKFVANEAGSDIGGRVQTSPTTYRSSSFFTELGLSYVSYGDWYLSDLQTDGASTMQTRGREVRLIYGERTAPSDLPASGKATYEGRDGILHLAADFGDRTITADLDSPARVEVSSDDYGHEYKNAIVGIKVSGSSSISSSADFTIPLAGNAIYPDVESKQPDILDPITGKFRGAFFGPQAAEVGGFVTLDSVGDSVWSNQPFLLEKR